MLFLHRDSHKSVFRGANGKKSQIEKNNSSKGQRQAAKGADHKSLFFRYYHWIFFKGLVIFLSLSLSFFFFFFFFFLLYRAIPMAQGGSQARGLIGATATGLHYSHSNARSEPHLQTIPQLTVTPDP